MAIIKTANYAGRQYAYQSNYDPTRLSVSIWTYPVSTFNYLQCVGKGVGRTKSGTWSLGVGATSKWGFYIQFSADGDPDKYGNWVETADTFTLNTWNHLLGVYDGANMLLYWNGALTTGEVQVIDIPPVSNDIRVLAKPGDASTYSGPVAEFAVWSTALTQQEADALAGGLPPVKVRQSDLLVYDPLFLYSNNVFVDNKTDSLIAGADHPRVMGKGV